MRSRTVHIANNTTVRALGAPTWLDESKFLKELDISTYLVHRTERLLEKDGPKARKVKILQTVFKTFSQFVTENWETIFLQLKTRSLTALPTTGEFESNETYGQ